MITFFLLVPIINIDHLVSFNILIIYTIKIFVKTTLIRISAISNPS